MYKFTIRLLVRKGEAGVCPYDVYCVSASGLPGEGREKGNTPTIGTFSENQRTKLMVLKLNSACLPGMIQKATWGYGCHAGTDKEEGREEIWIGDLYSILTERY